MDIVLTHGVLPTSEQFYTQFVKHCPNGIYTIANDPLLGDVSWVAPTVWEYIRHKYNSDNPMEVELVSCILETLSIEWV